MVSDLGSERSNKYSTYVAYETYNRNKILLNDKPKDKP